MKAPGAGERPTVLTEAEEITLRRVAFGQSEVRAMRSADLAQLTRLKLIEPSKDGPQLTKAGREIFETLPRAAVQERFRPINTLISELTDRKDKERR